MAWITPKTNWNSSDSYEYSDLNRVENNLQEVVALISAIGYQVGTYNFILNRTVVDVEYLSSVNRLEDILDDIRIKFLTPPTWLSKKSWTVGTIFDYTDANRWESNTIALKELVELIPQSYRYCGTFEAGSEGGLN